jgi:hypothetical protein
MGERSDYALEEALRTALGDSRCEMMGLGRRVRISQRRSEWIGMMLEGVLLVLCLCTFLDWTRFSLFSDRVDL